MSLKWNIFIIVGILFVYFISLGSWFWLGSGSIEGSMLIFFGICYGFFALVLLNIYLGG